MRAVISQEVAWGLRDALQVAIEALATPITQEERAHVLAVLRTAYEKAPR